LLWIELELSLLRMIESWDPSVPSEVCELVFWMQPLYNLYLLLLACGSSEKSSIGSSSESLMMLILSSWIPSNLSLLMRCS
jgi:hypothetical protein